MQPRRASSLRASASRPSTWSSRRAWACLRTLNGTNRPCRQRWRRTAGRWPSRTLASAPRLVLVLIVVPDPGLRGARVFIPPFRNQVEVVIGRVHHVDSASVGRVGVEQRAVLVFVKDGGPLAVWKTGIVCRIVVVGRP